MLNLRTSLKIAAALAVAILAAAGLGLSHATETSGQRHMVEIQNSRFAPDRLTVSPGDTVVWVNRDIVPHTATATDQSWDSETIETGASWEMTVTRDTQLNYLCLYHPSMVAEFAVAR